MNGTLVFLAANASYSHSSLAAACLRAACAGLPWTWHTVEVTLADEPGPVAERIAALRPDVVAATLYLFNRRLVLGALRAVSDLRPGCRFIVGGPECLGDNAPLLAAEPVLDAAVRGEGELALRALLERGPEPEAWAGIPGVCLRAAGRYADGGTALCAEPLDALPSAFGPHFPPSGKPFAMLETSRGCRNRCAFCTSGQGGGARYFALERVRHDLDVVRARGIAEVRLTDRTFNEDPARGVERLRLFREEYPDLRVHLEIDPALLTRPLLDEFDRARPGQLHLEAGVQSLSAKVYRAVGRAAGVRRTLDGVRALCARRQVDVHVDLMAGLPGQTLQGLYADVAALAALGPAEIQLEVLKLLPGTALERDRGALGLAADREPPYAVRATPDMPAGDVREAALLGWSLDAFYNTRSLHDVVVRASARLDGFWLRLAGLAREAGYPGVGVSLERRFRLLHRVLAAEAPDLAARVAYLWLLHGFSARGGLCPAKPWHGALPEGAVRVDGTVPDRVSRQYRVELDRPYLFVYGSAAGTAGRAIAAYALPEQS